MIDNGADWLEYAAMKIFWSWQSDTPGKTGRHFVRDCLIEAIGIINQEPDVSDAPEQSRLTLDQDRAGVAGHRNLGDLILRKIAEADLFVGDVTFVAELTFTATPDNPDGVKKLINSNVAVEYGYAVGKLTDDAILLVMNLHYGPLTKLPFDLAYKIAPCRYTLAPDASKDDITKARKALTKDLVETLKLHVARVTPPVPVPPPPTPFQRTASTTSAAIFWKPGDVLGSIYDQHPFRPKADPAIEYRFAPEHPFYLRLMPSVAIPEFDVTRIMDVVNNARLDAITSQFGHKFAMQNTYGAIAIVPTVSTTSVHAMSQIFRNGEIWGVTCEFVRPYENNLVVPMISLYRGLERALKSFVEVAHRDLGIALPYDVEIGAVGLKDTRLSVHTYQKVYYPQLTDQIFENALVFRSNLQSDSPEDLGKLLQEFVRRLYDLANFRYVLGSIP